MSRLGRRLLVRPSAAGRIALVQEPPVRSSAEPLEFRDVTKRYPGSRQACGRWPVAQGPRRGDLRPRRPLGLRQDDRHADGQPHDRHHLRRHPARRAHGQGPQARRAAPRDRLRHPARRPVSALDDRREHRDGPAASGLGQGAHRDAHRRAARAHRPAARHALALPQPAVRRPAPARRRRPRAGLRPAGHAHGRALRRDRPDQPRALAERVPAPAGRAAQDDRLRHPRHRRGDQDGRPHRDPAGGRHPRAVRARRPSS